MSFELLKKYKSQIALLSTVFAAGTTLFVKIDAYAQGKVDAGVEQLRTETSKEVTDLKADIKILKAEQQNQKEQLSKIDSKQDDVIHLLLDMKKDHK